MFWVNLQVLATAVLLYPSAATALPNNLIRPFYSRPDLKAPSLNVTLHSSGTLQEYLFVSPDFIGSNRPDCGPYIFDHLGNLIWSGVDAAGGAGAKDVQGLHVCSYQGQDHLCYWQGLHRGNYGTGLGVIMNRHYQIVKTVQAGSATASTDFHEFRLTEHNTALITIYNPRFHDGLWILDSIFQEVSLVDNHVVCEWRSLDHVDPSQCHVPAGSFTLVGDGSSADKSWDYFHINSIDQNEDGDYLISARHCDTILKISRLDGSIIWQLKGDNSSFTLSDFTFRRQHHARFREDSSNLTVISLFNNDNDGFSVHGPVSFGLIIEIDHETQIARKKKEYGATIPKRVISQEMGNLEYLANGNILINWGTDSEIAEFQVDETEVWRANLGWKSFNYRARKSAWVGSPIQPPALWTYARSTDSQTVFYASWNGATEVHMWRFYTSDSQAGPYQLAGEKSKNGFETVFDSPAYGAWTFVEALDVQNVSLRNSSKVMTYVPDIKVSAACRTWECFTAPILRPNEQATSWALEFSGNHKSYSGSRFAVGYGVVLRWVEMSLQIIGLSTCASFAVYRIRLRNQRYAPLILNNR